MIITILQLRKLKLKEVKELTQGQNVWQSRIKTSLTSTSTVLTTVTLFTWASLVAKLVKNVGDLGSIPGLGRFPGEGNSYPLQYSGLENSMDRGAWQATAHGVTKSQTQLSDLYFTSLQLCS